MIEIKKATQDDLQTIHDMAQIVFRHTYRDILSPEQMDYMMEMMYSLPNLQKQLEEGHHYYIAYDVSAPSCADEVCGNADRNAPCGYVSVQYQGKDDDGVEVYHLHKIYVMPQSQGRGVGMCLFQTVIDHVKSIIEPRIIMSGSRDTAVADGSYPMARIELNVNKHNSAVNFYKHIGMRIIHEEDYPIGNGFYKTDYIMALDL